MKGRRLLLASLDWTRPKDPPLSLGHASLFANLLKHKVDVKQKSWAVNKQDFYENDVVSYAMKNANRHTDIALGAFVWNERPIVKILRKLKENNFPGKIILGGPQISYVKDDVTNYYPDADIFVRGYGENALTELYKSSTQKPVIAGISYKGEPDLGISANVELDTLPSPYLTGIIRPQRFIRWETQRGCPFRCSFCQHRESDVTMTRRNMPKSRVLAEAEWITNNRIIQDVAILDPTFNSGPQYLDTLQKLIDGKFSGKLSLQCRLEMVKDEFLDLVNKLNKTGHVVLEFGIQTIHKEEFQVIQRPNNVKKIVEILNKTNSMGIETEISLIFGLPNQTLESFKSSVYFCKNLNVSRIYAFPLMLLRGTPLHSMKNKLGLIESDEINISGIDRIQEDIPHVVASPSFTYNDWKEMSKIAQDLESFNSVTAKDAWVSRVSNKSELTRIV